MNKKTMLLVALVIVLILASVLIMQSALPQSSIPLQHEATPTASATPIVNPTAPPSASRTATPPTEAPSPSPKPAVRIESVGIDNSTSASVTASSQTGGDVIITEIILKDSVGNTLATDDSIHQTLPADGSPVKIIINQQNVQFTLGGTFTLTIVTSYGMSYTSQSTYPPFY